MSDFRCSACKGDADISMSGTFTIYPVSARGERLLDGNGRTLENETLLSFCVPCATTLKEKVEVEGIGSIAELLARLAER